MLTADRIVLCAGAIGSGQLLMLSGVGPEAVLADAGIPVVLKSPVGERTSDHPEWVLPVDWTPTHDLPPLEAMLTTPNGLEVRPYTRGFGAMVEGAGTDPADRPHIGVDADAPRVQRQAAGGVRRPRGGAAHRASLRQRSATM